MLDAHRALILASATSSALKDRLLRDRSLQQSRLALRAILVQITPNTKHDEFRVQFLASIVCRAVFGAAATLDAGICLECRDLRYIFAVDETEVLVACERRNFAKPLPLQEQCKRA